MFNPSNHEVGSSSSSELPQSCRQLTFSEIQLATQNFDESLVLGCGGFGKVYKGTIANGANLLTVAIKRLDSASNQGAHEFWAEVKMLSDLRHCHLVSLIGYCNDGQEMILIYEYMSHGTLDDHLHKHETLSWVRRLTVCIGAARGLDYLHTGTGIDHGVIHRDVKSSNILLHNSWEAKISDFGLSKICPKNQQSTYVNTVVKGTFGYIDPDYFYTGKLTRKSDVYAFGVVLFEVLCGKRAVDRSLDEEQWNLAIWAQDSIKEGRLKQIVDTKIKGEIFPKCLKLFAQLAKPCLNNLIKRRPTMAEVVVSLESILALQEKTNSILQPTRMNFFGRKAPMVKSNEANSVARLNFLELFFDVVRGENQTLHQFDIGTLNVASESFSEAHKISQHTVDSLYKGKLQNGQHIAIVGPSLETRYKEYYMNEEASILIKLEHENLAKLFGYCIEGTQVFLVYEFALHASLDSLISDPVCTLLNWVNRYRIILGVARALVYLHKHAPVVIHCDVKLANILLDESFNPKLLSFNSARCLAINEAHCYMDSESSVYTAPESLFGCFSTRTDVYGFGLLVLEIVSGRRANMHFFEYNESLEEYVWRNWLEVTYSNIIDSRIDLDLSWMTRLIEIGLLCVNEDSSNRPTMEEVVGMLLDSSSPTPPMSKMRPRIIGVSLDRSELPDICDSDSDFDDDCDASEVEESLSEICPR